MKKSTSGGVTERSSKLEQLLARDSIQQKATRQQTDTLLDMIASEATISEQDVSVFSGAMLFTAQDVKRMFEGKNKLVERLNTV